MRSLLQEHVEVLKAAGLSPIRFGLKEGLAMINGTEFITALGSEAVARADTDQNSLSLPAVKDF